MFTPKPVTDTKEAKIQRFLEGLAALQPSLLSNDALYDELNMARAMARDLLESES